MKNIKKLALGILITTLLLSNSLISFASYDYDNPSEALAALTDYSLQEIITKRQQGISYGAIADESGKLSEFKEAMLEIHKTDLEQRVSNGYLSQAKADYILSSMKEHQNNCTTFEDCGQDYCNSIYGAKNDANFGHGRGKIGGHHRQNYGACKRLY